MYPDSECCRFSALSVANAAFFSEPDSKVIPQVIEFAVCTAVVLVRKTSFRLAFSRLAVCTAVVQLANLCRSTSSNFSSWPTCDNI